MKLSQRLRAIADRIEQGSRVADIGTDHAYLPIALFESGRCRRIIACDVRRKPLENARKNCAEYGANGVELRLGDGLSALAPGEADTIVVAGMGGDVIVSILDGCRWIRDPGIRLILQPMTSAEVLRCYLAEKGYQVDSETAVADEGRIYPILCVHYDGIHRELLSGEEYIGKIRNQTPENRAYLQKQAQRVEHTAEQLSAVAGKENEKAALTAAGMAIRSILEE